jgi:RHS repeat-associated protein
MKRLFLTDGRAVCALLLLLCGVYGTASACDADPNGSPKCAAAGNPINVITGNKFQVETDLPALPGMLGLEIVRYYNSGLSGRHNTLGVLGRGWRLSYESELAAIGDTVQIRAADGTRYIFSRDVLRPSLCNSTNPSDGTVTTRRTPAGEEFVWRQNDGRRLTFNPQGKLVQIQAPTGEFVSLQHDARGLLVKVTDPQGRSLVLNYLASMDAQAGDRFRGVQSIDSPVGRFGYSYGSLLPQGANASDPTALLANLVRVSLPGGQDQARLYHYEDARRPTFLTGVSVAGRDDKGKPVVERYSTFGYDIDGKAILSTHAGGADKITLDTSVGGRTVLTNSLGQKTVYRYSMVAGAFRLLEVRGAGCSLCGEMDVRYGYDSQGRVTEVTRLDHDGQPLQTTKTELDYYGRPRKVSKLVYHNGKAGAAQLVARYEYAAGTAPTPSLIARPSVVPGREMIMRISYGNGAAILGVPEQISESGFVPTYDGRGVAQAITRTMRYRHNGYNQRIEMDGPLANAKDKPGPDNSDITRSDYDPKTKLVTRTVAPGNFVTEVLERDAALRPAKVRSSDGYTSQLATIRSNWRGQPEQVTIEAAVLNPDGSIDAGTRLTRTLQYRYDMRGRLASITAPGQLTTRFVYDAAGRLHQRILPDGSSIVMTQDTEGRQRSEARHADSDPAGKALSSLRYHYDDAGRVAKVDDEAGLRGRADYTELGQIARMTNALGIATQFDYDDNGLLVARTEAAGMPDAATIRLAYDNHGQPTMITDANGVTTIRRYDDFGRKVAETNPDRGAMLYRHDEAGRLVARIDESGTTTRYRYDHANRLLALGADKQTDLVQYHYQGMRLSEMVSTVDGRAEHAIERTQYQRNSLGQVTQERRWIARVDQQGSIEGVQTISARPAYPLQGLTFITGSSYDDADRVLEQVLPDGHRLRYLYTAADTKAGRPGQLNALLFDERVIVTDIEQTLTGGLTGYTMGNGVRQQIEFDNRGRVRELKAVTQTVRPGQGLLARWWAQVQSWLGDKAVAGGMVIYGQTNTYDGGERLTSIVRRQATLATTTPIERSERYGYDNLNRLTTMDASNGTSSTLRYDKGGNRIAESGKDGERNYHYASGSNRLIALISHEEGNAETSESAQVQSAWLYHPTGVPLAQLALMRGPGRKEADPALDRSRRIVYNSAKRPIAVYDTGRQLIARYFYNGEGERIAKSVYAAAGAAANTSYSLYRDQRLAAETDANGHISTHYIYLYGKPLAKIDMAANNSLSHSLWKFICTLGGSLEQDSADASDTGASIYAIHTDHLGTPQAVTDEREQLVWQAETTPFGLAKVTFAAFTSGRKPFELNLRLPGQVFDAETGLSQNYYRDYDPQLGRYVTADPMGIDGDPNPYLYVGGNPLRNVDPLGLFQSDIHYYMTFFLAVAAGMDVYEARVLALATQYVDNNPDTEPINLTGSVEDLGEEHRRRLLSYHFTMIPSKVDGETGLVSGRLVDYKDPPNSREYVNIVENAQLVNLSKAAKTSDSQENLLNKRCTQLQFMGEYLHAFEDTFAHRDSNNNPFGLNAGAGHLAYGSNPDYTYNHYAPIPVSGGFNWNHNEQRTLEAEKEVLTRLEKLGDPKKSHSGPDMEKILKEFNAIKENEGDNKYDPLDPSRSEKIKLLEKTIQAWSKDDPSLANINLTNNTKPDFKGYSVVDGGKNRNKYLCDTKGKALDQKEYAGTILPSCK